LVVLAAGGGTSMAFVGEPDVFDFFFAGEFVGDVSVSRVSVRSSSWSKPGLFISLIMVLRSVWSSCVKPGPVDVLALANVSVMNSTSSSGECRCAGGVSGGVTLGVFELAGRDVCFAFVSLVEA